MLGPFIVEVDAFLAALRRGRAVNVNDQSSKERVIALATQYFNNLRPQLLRSLGESASVLEHDADWQQFVELAQGNNARQSYTRVIGRIRRNLRDLNVTALVAGPAEPDQESARITPSREEAQILETLDHLVPSAAASYRQGFNDLNGADRLSYRGTAAEFREALRETLDHLAPDDQVMAQAGFTLETNQTRPTMKQKMRYVLTSRGRNKTTREAAEKSLSLIGELSGEVMRAVYNRASLATHMQESKAEVKQIKRYVDTVLFDLLEIAQ